MDDWGGYMSQLYFQRAVKPIINGLLGSMQTQP